MKLNEEQKDYLKMYLSGIVIGLIFSAAQVAFFELDKIISKL